MSIVSRLRQQSEALRYVQEWLPSVGRIGLRRGVFQGKGVAFIGATLVGLLLYLPLLTRHYDPNGIIEAQAVESGALFNPHHILNRPVGFLLYYGARLLGYDGPSVTILQLVSAVAGAIGLGLAFIAFYHLGGSRAIAAVGTAWLGTSWAYWSTATDVSYLIPTATLVAAILAWLTKRELAYRDLVGVGLLYSLSLLMCKCNAVFMPALLLGALWASRARTLRERVVALAVVAAASVVPAGLFYLGVGVIAYSYTTIPQFADWLLRYRDQLPMYGQVTAETVPSLVVSTIASFIPVWSGLGLRDLLRGEVSVDNIAGLSSLLALAAGGTLSLYCLLSGGLDRVRDVWRHGWLIAGYLSYMGFIAWWEPQAVVWHVLPNILLLALITRIVSRMPNRRQIIAIYAGCVTVMAMVNFMVTIWPHRAEASPYMALAQCVAERMGPNDLFVATDWNWADYLSYFYGRETLNMIYVVAHLGDKDKAYAEAKARIEETRRRGGVAYIMEVTSYPPEFIRWLAAQTGLGSEDLWALAGQPAFDCEGVAFREAVAPGGGR